jgi:hypothetical protein
LGSIDCSQILPERVGLREQWGESVGIESQCAGDGARNSTVHRVGLVVKQRQSWQQEQLAHDLAIFEHLVCADRLGERQPRVNSRMELAGGEHADECPHAGTPLFDQVIPGVDGELPHRGRVSAQTQRRL